MGNRVSRRIALAALLTLPAAHARPGHASVVEALDIGGLTARAEQVVVAEVLSVKGGWTRGGSTIVSRIELAISESWKGEMPKDRRLTLLQLGGEVDDVVVRVHGQAEFAEGERAVLFLRRTKEAYALVGLGQGKRPLRFEAQTRRWMADPGDDSAAVRIDASGRFLPAPPQAPIPLDDLRRRVRALVQP